MKMAYRSTLSANSSNVSHLQAASVYKVICLDGSTASTVLSLTAWFSKAPFKKGLQWPRLDGQVSSPHQVCPSNGSWDTVWGLSHSVVSISLQPYGLQPTRLHCPWDVPGTNTRVGCHALLQGIFPTQELNLCLLCLLHQQTDSLPLSHQGSP